MATKTQWIFISICKSAVHSFKTCVPVSMHAMFWYSTYARESQQTSGTKMLVKLYTTLWSDEKIIFILFHWYIFSEVIGRISGSSIAKSVFVILKNISSWDWRRYFVCLLRLAGNTCTNLQRPGTWGQFRTLPFLDAAAVYLHWRDG